MCENLSLSPVTQHPNPDWIQIESGLGCPGFNQDYKHENHYVNNTAGVYPVKLMYLAQNREKQKASVVGNTCNK